MLRSAQGARLEARAASLQPFFHPTSNFLTASKSGDPGRSAVLFAPTPASRGMTTSC
jgi:hypothetical protein